MPEEIEIRSESMRDIIGYIPNWIIRWGITVALLIIIVLLVGTWFFKYPDVIKAKIIITTEQPVASVVARASGKIDCLFVKDNDEIKKGKVLAVIDNPADYKAVLRLKTQLLKFKSRTNNFSLAKNLVLGELQPYYANLEKSNSDYKHFFKLDYHNKKILSKNRQIEKQNKLYKLSIDQKNIFEQEVKLSEKQYLRAMQLTNREISQAEFENYHAGYLQAQRSLKGLENSLENINLRIVELEGTILDFKLGYANEKKQLELNLIETFENLNSRISLWEQSYVLKSPIVGEVSFNKFWSVNQNVKIGDIVLTILPNGDRKIIGKLELPLLGAGKVKTGQTANIKLDSYPFKEYGTVNGIVEDISEISADEKYRVEVSLPEGLKTSYKKTLEFSQEMHGTAEIITEDIRLFMRILSPLRTLLKKHYVEE